MREVSDLTRRFSKRPYYQQSELDRECEDIITEFLVRQYGKITFPIATDDLETLVEEHVEDLDSYGDLSSYGNDVEGATLFSLNTKPKVIISGKIHNDPSLENRYRTTLAHEFGHVRFHGYLFSMEMQEPLWSGEGHKSNEVVCKRDKIINAPNSQIDWMEWQAGYVCSSLLVPITSLTRLVKDFRKEVGHLGDIAIADIHATNLIDRVSETYKVSRDAARVRLIKLNILTQNMTSLPLF